MDRKKNVMRSQLGFTIIEVMVALVVLCVGMLALNGMQISSTQGNATAKSVLTASTWNSDILEQIAALPYSDSLLSDTDNDGTAQDNDENNGRGDGIDDQDAGKATPTDEFGLNDVGANADHQQPTQDGVYTIYWNIAVGHPINNNKTIRAIVVRNSDQAQLAIFDYIKSEL